MARSALPALARMAMPTLVRWRKSASATNAIGATTIAMIELASKTIPLIVISALNGGSIRAATRRGLPHARGSRMAATASSWARPSVATVRISRGAVKKRRITASSTIAPRRSDATRPTGTARK